MKFAEKKEAYQKLQDASHLEADRALLQKKNPKSTALSTGIVDRVKSQRDILWALLDVATLEEIIANRPAPAKVYTKDELSEFADKAAKLSNDIHSVATLEEKAEIIRQISELIAPFPEKTKDTILKFAESIIPDPILKAEFTLKLQKIDIETAKQPELAAIARALKIQTPDYKSATLRPLLQEYLLNLPKESEGTGEEMTGIEAEIGKENELTVEGSTDSHSDQMIDILNAEKEELAGKVENLTAEKEELEDQLFDAEGEKAELEEQLEEEKKSEASQDPA